VLLIIDEKHYEIPDGVIDEMVMKFFPLVMQEWGKVPESLRFAAKPVARKLLYDMEKKTRETSGEEKAIALCRPPLGKDAVEHFLLLLLGVFAEGIKRGKAQFTVDTDGKIARLSFEFRHRQNSER
jgi:hypothetical protein